MGGFHRWAALVAVLFSAACYTNTPVDIGVRPISAGDVVALDISDQGRVRLAERFGPGVTQIEGRVRTLSDRAWELQVSRVAYLREGDSQWTGETVVVEREHVSRVYERKFSKGRTIAAAGAVGGVLVAFIVTRALSASGRSQDPDKEPPGPDQLRFPRYQPSH